MDTWRTVSGNRYCVLCLHPAELHRVMIGCVTEDCPCGAEPDIRQGSTE